MKKKNNIGCVNSDGTFDYVCVDSADEFYPDDVTSALKLCRDYNECRDGNDNATHTCDTGSTVCNNILRYEPGDFLWTVKHLIV